MAIMLPEPGTLAELLRLHALGLRLVPLNGKVPLRRQWTDSTLTTSEIHSWHASGVNWGIVTGDPLVVLDTDTEAAEDWVRDREIHSPVMVRTGRGGLHRYFRCPPDVQIHSRSGIQGVHGLDLRGWRSYVVAAGSVHQVTGKRYAYLHGRELRSPTSLPFFNPDWVRDPTPPLSASESRLAVSAGRVRDVRRYVHAIPSIQGHGGDRACFTVACLLAEAGLTVEQMIDEMRVWNRECAFPRWSQEELLRKVRYARERVLSKGRCA
jgi:hypothetical protein